MRTVPQDTAFGVDHSQVDRVRAQLQVVDRLGVAFSGGVDSSVLLALATATLGPARVVDYGRVPQLGLRRAQRRA